MHSHTLKTMTVLTSPSCYLESGETTPYVSIRIGLQATVHSLFSPGCSLFASKGQLHVLPSEIISKLKLFALKKSEIDRVFDF
jgi:hypothetical protein